MIRLDDLLPAVGWYHLEADLTGYDSPIAFGDLAPVDSWRGEGGDQVQGRAVILDSGEIVTALHCVGGEGNMVTLEGPGGSAVATVTRVAERMDLAELILAVPISPHSLEEMSDESQPGDSGGPMMMSGCCVGIVTRTDYWVPAADVLAWIEDQ